MTRTILNIGRWGLSASLLLLSGVLLAPSALGQQGLVLPGLIGDGDHTQGATVTVLDADFHSPGAELPPNLIDNSVTTKWLDFRGDGWESTTAGAPGNNDVIRTVPHVSVYLDLSSPQIVGAYTITSANDVPSRDPYSWTLAGTNVANPTDADFVQIHSITGATFNARFQTRVWEIPTPPTTAYKTYRFNFLTQDVALNGIPPAPPAVFNTNVLQMAEIELLTQFIPSEPRLEINRSTGGMTFINATIEPLNIVGYSITSARGTLNSNTWLSITDNYDGDSGTTTILDNDRWIRLTAPNGRTDLSEVEEPSGDGMILASGATINLGPAWIKYPVEDIQAEVLLADGSTKGVIVTYLGNNDQPFVFGDLNFIGGITVADWNTFKQGQNFNFSTVFSRAESYARGDLDGDFDWDLDDFGIFKAAFDAANGAGSFDAMLASVPEPGTAALVGCVAALLASGGMFRRRGGRCLMLFLFVAAIGLAGGEAAYAGKVLPGLIGGDLTNPSNMGAPVVAVSAGDQANSPALEGPLMALDNNVNTKWLAFQPNGTFYQIQFDGGAQHVVNTYTITSANDFPVRDPYRWTLSGSNDGTNFTVVDQQSAQTFSARFQTQQFVVGNRQAYNIYRFDFLTALGAGALNPGAPNSIQIAEIELFNRANPEILTLEVNPMTGSIRIANNSEETISFDAYRIRSPSGALNFANWSGGPLISNNGGQSIHDQNLPGFPRGNGTGNGWEEALAGSSDFDLTELYLGTGGVGSSALGAEQGITMNNIFRVGGAQDLIFEYRSFGQNVRGFVQYLGAPLQGDYNGDGKVDAADYILWRKTDGTQPGYTAWRSNFGQTGGSGSLGVASSVPEPSSGVLALLLVPLLLMARRRGAVRGFITCAYGAKVVSSALAAVVGHWSFVIRHSSFLVALCLSTAALASTLDRDFKFGDDPQENATAGQIVGTASALPNFTLDSMPPFQDLMQTNNPTYVNVQSLSRPGVTSSQLGIQFNGASSQLLSGAGLGSPPEGGGPIGQNYPTSRWMQVWARPTLNNGMRQEIVSDTFQFGIFITPNGTWGHTYGSAIAPANLGDDYDTGVPVQFNQWTHIMQRTFTNTGVVVYINGVAVSRFNAAYTMNTGAISPEPNRNMYVGAGSGGASNFFTGQLDNLKIAVSGDNSAAGGQNWGDVNLATENDYIAFSLANMGFVHGDVNGDGVVNGDGTGPASSDDVRFFIDHWLAERRVNNILTGDLISRTTIADLNFDGRTSLADWAILRAAHAGGGSLDLAALLAGAVPGVPEPSTAALAGLALLSFWGGQRRRRWRVTWT